MLTKNTRIKLIIGLSLAAGVIAATPFVLYLKVLPAAVSNPKIIKYVENTAEKYAKVDLNIEQPVLKTNLSPVIDFKVKTILLTKNNKKLLELENLNTSVSFAEILKKNIIINRITAKYIFADVNRLTELVPQQKEQKTKQESEWNFDLFDTFMGVKSCEILYTVLPNTHIKVLAKDLAINNAEKVKRFVKFKVLTEIDNADKHVKLAIADDNKVYISNKAIYIDNCPLNINKSKLFINAEGHKNKKYRLEIASKNFNIQDIIRLIETQVVENNLGEILAYFGNLNGSFDFKFKLTESDMRGILKLNKLNVNIVPVDNIPICLTGGIIDLDSREVKLKDFKGYYDNNPVNKLEFQGGVKDYLKSIDTEITGKAAATNDFFKIHLSHMANYPIELTGQADAFVTLKSKNNIIDLKGLFTLPRDVNILVGDEPLPFSKAGRALTADMHFEDMILDINSIKYYMESKNNDKRDERRPIFTLDGSIDAANNNFVRKVGFEIPDPLPSEFLNVVAKQNIFKKGTISGKLAVDNTGKYPVLQGDMDVKKVIIPAQRTFIRDAQLKTGEGIVHINAFGKYKRSDYKFTGDIVNEIKFPIIVKNIHLSLDYLDLYKLMTGTNSTAASQDQQNTTVVSNNTGDEVDLGDGETAFDISNVIIEKCIFSLDKGVYKDINFGNINANLTLDQNSILNINSNRFDIAEGNSSLKVHCDLKKSLYHIWLGIKDVNSDIMAGSLLNLKREITGKASGMLALSTDNSLKLNGTIKFLVQNGTIQKVGLVEYALKFAALFRNPVTMISPSTLSDLVNIPEGNFDRISGELDLKDNVIEKIRIKSSAPQLSSYIAGRYDLETKDTSMRIYTKFSSQKKGFAGFLRNISLNSLATRMPMSSRNDANYYSAEISQLPPIDADEKDCQIFLTKVEGDVENNNFLSSLKKIK